MIRDLPAAGLPLCVEGVSKDFGMQIALRGVSLHVAAGEMAGLLGPNGAGKTTLLRIAAGLMDGDAGQVQIFGSRQSRWNRSVRRWVGLVSLDTPFYAELTVRESLVLQASLQGLPRHQRSGLIERLSREYGLEEMLDRRMGALSTGMLQRTRIARAMLHEPRLLLLDEPTNGLDPQVRRMIWEILRQLAARGVAILMSTHNLREAAELCAGVHLLHHGRLLGSHRCTGAAAGEAGLEKTYLEMLATERAAGEAL